MLGPVFLHYDRKYTTYRQFTDFLEGQINDKISCCQTRFPEDMSQEEGYPTVGKLMLGHVGM
jgi:hypothetical protein